MNDFYNRLKVIDYIVKKEQKIYKTALVKILFVAQELYNVPLKYRFGLHIYGPYAPEISSEIIYLEQNKNIYSTPQTINNYVSYELTPAEQLCDFPEDDQNFINTHKNTIDKILEYMADMPVKELELVSTIIFVWSRFYKDEELLIKKVNEIKPHFKSDKILKKYNELLEKEFLSQELV